MNRAHGVTVAGVLLALVLAGPGWGQPGDDAGEAGATAEQELHQLAEQLLEETVCPKCQGLGLLLKEGKEFSRELLGDPWCARPDRMCLEPLARKMTEEDPRGFPQAHVCRQCWGLGFRFTPRTLRLYDDLRKEMHLREEDLSAEAQEQLRRQMYLFNLARGYFRIIEEITRPHLPDQERLLRRMVKCSNLYEYRLLLCELFTALVQCFPPGEPTLERDRQAREGASKWKRSEEIKTLIQQLGGVRIPGSNLSFAEWWDVCPPRWDLLETVYQQQQPPGAPDEVDLDLEQTMLNQARALSERAVCSHCKGSGMTTRVRGSSGGSKATIGKADRPMAKETSTTGPSKGTRRATSGRSISRGSTAPTVTRERVPCPFCNALGWRVNNLLYSQYQRFSERLQEARPRMSSQAYEEAWTLSRQFHFKALVYSWLLKVQRPGASRGRLNVADLAETGRILMHSFSAQAQSPEADQLAQYRKTQFLFTTAVGRVSRLLGRARIVGTSLTLGDWAAGPPPELARKGEGREQEEGSSPAEPPPPPPPAPDANIPVVDQ